MTLVTVANATLDAVERAQRQVRASEERYRTYVEQSPDAIWRAELEQPLDLGLDEEEQFQGMYRYAHLAECNGVMARMYGFADPNEAVGMSFDNLMRPLGSQAAQIVRTFFHSGCRLNSFEVCVHGRQGTEMHFLCSVIGVVQDRMLVGAWGTLRDISDRKWLEEQLLRSQRLEVAGRVAGQVAHDFNNLLSPMTVYPDLIKAQLPEGHAASQFCDAMMEAALRMAEINEDLMTLGRRGLLEQEPFDLNQQVRWALEHVPSSPDSLAIRVELSPDLRLVNGSAAQLSRVIANLLLNAREAMQDAGLLSIRTENVYLDGAFGHHPQVEVGEYAVLHISDTGHGIPEGIRDKIFDAFFTTNKAKRRCSGLGLSVVEAIVKDHRGYIELGTEVGKGTTFSIYLPASDEATREVVDEGMVGGTESILVVDDDPLQREVSTRLLTSLGYRVRVAANGDEAVACLGDEPADLLILDMIMPDLDGLESYRGILQIRPGQKAIIVSGFSDSGLVRQVQALGAGSYVRKPVVPRKLARAVRAELDRESGREAGVDAPVPTRAACS